MVNFIQKVFFFFFVLRKNVTVDSKYLVPHVQGERKLYLVFDTLYFIFSRQEIDLSTHFLEKSVLNCFKNKFSPLRGSLVSLGH